MAYLATICALLLLLAAPARAGTMTKVKSDNTRFFAELTEDELDGLKGGVTLVLKFRDHPEPVEAKLLKLNLKKGQGLFLVADPPDYFEPDLPFTVGGIKGKSSAGGGGAKGGGAETAGPNGQTWSTASGIASLYTTSASRTDFMVQRNSQKQETEGVSSSSSSILASLRQAFSFGKKQGGVSLEAGTIQRTFVDDAASTKVSQVYGAFDLTKSFADLAIVGLSATYQTFTTKGDDTNVKGSQLVPAVTLGGYKKTTLFLLGYTPKSNVKLTGDLTATIPVSSTLSVVFETRLADALFLSAEGSYDMDDAPHEGRATLTFAERATMRTGLGVVLGPTSCFDAGVIRNRSSFPGRLGEAAPVPALGLFAGVTLRFGSWDVKLAAEGAYGAISHTYTPEDENEEPVTSIQTNHMLNVMLRTGVKY